MFHSNSDILNFLKNFGIIHFDLANPTKIDAASKIDLVLLGVHGSFECNLSDSQECIYFLDGDGRIGINSTTNTIPVTAGDIIFFQKNERYYLSTDEGLIAIRETTDEINLDEIEKLILNLSK